MASMHFVGRAACWLQYIERRVRQLSWSEFCIQIHDRFGREQHASLILRLFHIRQLGSVAEYVEQFATLVDLLAAYEANHDPLYYTMRFIDGLRDDIKSVIMVHRPATLDTACSLALVQEEAMAPGRTKRSEPHWNRQLQKSGHNTAVQYKGDQAGETSEVASNEEMLLSLRRSRRARGLCEKCAEKWVHGHKCTPTAQLRAMEEVWQLLDEEQEEETDPETSEPNTAQLCMVMSKAAWSGLCPPQTLKFQGFIQQHPIAILVDSGSSHTFLSENMRPLLQGVIEVPNALKVQVANGEVLQCQYKP